MSLATLPTLNAILNATSACLVIGGLVCIKARKLAAHGLFMASALVASALFLVSYLIYHAQVGSVRFLGTGWIRPVYFTILITHTILAIVIVPWVLRTVWLAVQKQYAAHMVLARKTVPLWLYVSVSGVVVYWMLYHYSG